MTLLSTCLMLYQKNNVPHYTFGIFGDFNNELLHAVSGREGGKSSGPFESLNFGFMVGDREELVAKNYRLFCEELGIDLNKVALAHQEHTDQLMVIKEDRDFDFENPLSGLDGFITNVPGIYLAVRFADCQGILLFDPIKKVVGAIHSGWRGNAQNIIGKGVQQMKLEFGSNPADILAAVSPSLGPCCAEFSEPERELPDFMHQYIQEDSAVFKVDLWRCCYDQLLAAGLKVDNIEMAERCTVCENDKFFSYRGGKKTTGHMIGIIGLKKTSP